MMGLSPHRIFTVTRSQQRDTKYLNAVAGKIQQKKIKYSRKTNKNSSMTAFNAKR